MSITHIEKTIANRRIRKNRTKSILLGLIISAAVMLFTAISIFCVESEIELSKLGTSSLADIAYVLLAFLIVVILTAGVSVKSIYEVLLVNDMIEFRRLKLIGATSDQLKHIVGRERRTIFWSYAIIGAALGVVISLFFPISKSIPAIILCAVASLIVMDIVVIGCTGKIVKRVMNVSISDDLANIQAPKKKRKSDVRGLTRNPVAFLGKRYLFSGGKRTILTLFSLTLSFMLSFVIFSVIASFDEDKLAKSEYKHDSDFIVALQGNHGDDDEWMRNSPFTPELEEKIRNVNGVEDIVKFKCLDVVFENDKDTHTISCGDVNVSASSDDGVVPIIINEGAYWYQNGSLKFKEGDRIEAEVNDGKKVTLLVEGFVNSPYDLNIYYTSEENWGELTSLTCDQKWYIKADDKISGDSVKELKGLIEPKENLSMSSLSEYTAQLKDVFAKVRVAIYIVCIIVCLFTLINMFDLTVNNMEKRKKDIGIYRALGMSDRQVCILNYIEIGFLIILSGIGGIVIGTPLGRAICKIMADTMRSEYLVYVFPLRFLIVYIVALILIVLIMRRYIRAYVTNVQIVENIYG
ncbi:MAG: ABC transporter permease [Clostridia bacterium]|nr:ABC transporter permease [Clostridia bacterium]